VFDFAQRHIEEVRLQHALLEEGAYLRVSQGGDIAEALCRQRGLPLGLDHSPVAHHHHLGNPELLLQNRDLAGHRRRVRGVALEDAHGEGLAVLGGQ